METPLVNSRVFGASGATVRADIADLIRAIRAGSCNSGGNRKFELFTIANSCKKNSGRERKIQCSSIVTREPNLSAKDSLSRLPCTRQS